MDIKDLETELDNFSLAQKSSNERYRHYLSNGLSYQQARFILAFFTRASVKEAAKEVGISITQAHRWLDDARFLSVFQEIQHKLFSLGIGQIQNLTLKSIAALEQSLDSPVERYRIRAAEILLEHSIQVQTARLIEEKLNVLERRLNELSREDSEHGKLTIQSEPSATLHDYLKTSS